jgi:hypothetical protein
MSFFDGVFIRPTINKSSAVALDFSAAAATYLKQNML